MIDKAFTDDELLKAKFPKAKSAIKGDSYSLVIHVTVRAGMIADMQLSQQKQKLN